MSFRLTVNAPPTPDRPTHHLVHRKKLTDLYDTGRIGAHPGLLEALFGENRFHLVALNDGERAGCQKLAPKAVGDRENFLGSQPATRLQIKHSHNALGRRRRLRLFGLRRKVQQQSGNNDASKRHGGTPLTE